MSRSVTTMTKAATNAPSMRFAWAPSPIGKVLLSGDELGLLRVQVDTPCRSVEPAEGAVEDAEMFCDAIEQLQAYFAGDLQAFDLKLNPQGTEFQKRAWAQLQRIPFGQTITYGEQARRLGDPKACRAVGAANGQNPLGIIVPCHRVIGSTGKLTGFAGGLDAKAWLLNHESGLFARS